MDPYEKLFKSVALFKYLHSIETNESKYKKVVDFLENGGDVNVVDYANNNNTILHTAIEIDDHKIVKKLLDKNADVTIQNIRGKNSLEWVRSLEKKKNTDKIMSLLESHLKPTPNVKFTMEQLKYKKKDGTSGVQGQLYETKLLSLILFRVLNHKEITEFFLGTNIDGVGVFDDISLRYKLNNDSIEKMIFVQAKHREDPDKQKLSISDLRSDSSSFGIAGFFESYMKIKQTFKKDSSDIMFKGEFEDMDCVFVLFTPSKNSIPKKYKVSQESHQIQDVLHVEDNSDDIFQIRDTNLVLEATASKRIQELGALLKSTIVENNKYQISTLMSNEIIQRYHVVLAQKVFHVSEIILTRETSNKASKQDPVTERYREGQFRSDFFTTKDDLLVKLNSEMFKDMTPDKREECKSKIFFLPIMFGNIDLHVRKPGRIISLSNDFMKLLNKQRNTNIIKIDESIFQKEGQKNEDAIQKGFVQLNGGIAGLVGNLLIFDEETRMLKFQVQENVVQKNASELFQYLLNGVEKTKMYNYRFDIDIKNFPVLFLEGDENDRRLAREFLRTFWFLTNQPKESQLETFLKIKIESNYKIERKGRLFRIQSDAIFLKFHDAVQKWWLNQKDPIYYLSTACDFFKNSKNIVVDSPKLTVLDFVFRNKIKKNDIKFRQNTIEILNLEDFVNNESFNVLNIITAETYLTITKLVQHFDTTYNIDVTFLDLKFLIEEKYYDMVENELMNISQSSEESDSKIKIFVIFHKKHEYTKDLYNLINILSQNQKNKIIVVSENNTTEGLRDHLKILIHLDENISLIDILDSENLLKNWTVSFQGDTSKICNIIDAEVSKRLIHSEILWKLINNYNIEIGKPIVNDRYEEVKKYCIPRNLIRENEFVVESFEDINESVVIVVAEPGMGKSMLLNHLAFNSKYTDQKNSNSSNWIVNVNLLDYISEFKRWKDEKVNIDLNEALRFACKVSVNGLRMINTKINIGSTDRSDLNAFKIMITGNDILWHSFIKDKKTSFELELFLHNYQKGNVIFLFDGFDEVCPHYEKEVVSMVKALSIRCHVSNCELLMPLSIIQNTMNLLSKVTPVCNCKRLTNHQQRVWITTRSYNNIRNTLERELGITAYALKPLSKLEQELYLKQYMKIHFSFNEYIASETEISNLCGFFDYMNRVLLDENTDITIFNMPLFRVYFAAVEYFQTQKSTFIAFDDISMEILWEKCNDTVAILEKDRRTSRSEYDISQNPLHMYIAAEYFRAEVKSSVIVVSEMNGLNNKWDLKLKSFSLFEHFLETKFKISFEEKKKVDINIPDNDIMYKNTREEFIQKHKSLALLTLFEENDLLSANIISESELKKNHDTIKKISIGEEKSGVVDRVVDNLPRFVHLVFAEFCAVEYICDKLKNSTTLTNQEILWHFIINIILYKSSGGIRTFFDLKLQEDSDLIHQIDDMETKKIVFDTLIKQGKNNTVIPEGFSNILQVLRTSFNVAIEENLVNVQKYFLECITSSVNETNLEEFVEMVANSMLLITAIGANNDNFLHQLNDCISHVGTQDNILSLLLPTYIKKLPLPFSINLENMPRIESALSRFLPRVLGFNIENMSVTPSIRNVAMDYIKLLWDLTNDRF